MNVSDFADFADMLTAIAVIASLLFVAFQVRQNTRALRNQHFEATLDHLASLFSRTLDERVATVLDRGKRNFADLSEPEKIMFGSWANEYIMGATRLIAFAQQGLLDPKIAAMTNRRLEWFFKYPGMGQWWRDYDRHPVPAHFEAIVDKTLSEMKPNPS